MNKKPVKIGPRIRITRPSLRFKKEEPFQDERKYIYTCQYCRLKFTQNSHYFRHMSSNHELQQRQATYQCDICQVVFAKKSNLDHHCQTQHQIRSKSTCEACAITFKSRYCLQRHLKLKQMMQENSCLKCQKKFLSNEELIKHVTNKHTYKNITFQCEYCKLKFRAKESLQSHIDRIHKFLLVE